MNTKASLIVCLLLSYCSTHYGQCEETISLAPTKDAQVWSYDPLGEYDRGTNRTDIVIYEWTKNGAPTTKYGLIEFDLSTISEDTNIDRALLSLFHDPESIDPGHSRRSGSNEFYIHRLLGPWEESVAWGQVPMYSEMNKILVPASSSETQNYIDIDITQLIKDILETPDSNFGLLLKLKTTQYYRSVVFASSEHPNSDLHPTLKIISSSSTTPINSNPLVCDCDAFEITPNLSNDIVTLNLNQDLLLQKEVSIFNSLGQLIATKTVDTSQLKIDVSNFSDGYYYISIPCKETVVLRFVVTKS